MTEEKRPRWYSMTEEEKLDFVMEQALQKCQESIWTFTEHCPEAKEYIQLMKDVLDWIASKTGHAGLPMYPGEGLCGTVQFLKQNEIGDDNGREIKSDSETTC
jgi:hypothetical protein